MKQNFLASFWMLWVVGPIAAAKVSSMFQHKFRQNFGPKDWIFKKICHNFQNLGKNYNFKILTKGSFGLIPCQVNPRLPSCHPQSSTQILFKFCRVLVHNWKFFSSNRVWDTYQKDNFSLVLKIIERSIGYTVKYEYKYI